MAPASASSGRPRSRGRRHRRRCRSPRGAAGAGTSPAGRRGRGQRPEDVLVGAVDVLLNDGFVSHLRANSVRVEDLGGAEVVGRFGDVGLPGPNESTYSSTVQVVPGLDDPIGVPVDRVLRSRVSGTATPASSAISARRLRSWTAFSESSGGRPGRRGGRTYRRTSRGRRGPGAGAEYRSHLRPGGDTQQRVPVGQDVVGRWHSGPPRRSIATR